MPTDKALWVPNLIVPTIAEIDFSQLPVHLEYIIFDVDNTLARPIHCPKIPGRIRMMIHEANKCRFKSTCLLSNMVIWLPSRERRIQMIKSMVGADHIVCAYWPRLKPCSWPFEMAVAKMEAVPEKTIMVGDQLRTDILGGNRLGMFTIKAEPLGPDPWWVAWKRRKEQRLMASWE